MKDILERNSSLFLIKHGNYPEVSLLHNEYPTNFRYQKSHLLNGYPGSDEEIRKRTNIEVKTGDRGNYDLSILNREFIENMLESPVCLRNSQGNGIDNNDLNESIKNIINKKIDYPIIRKKGNENKFKEELLYAIEVKFIHPFNARSKNMLEEVIKDNHKLNLTRIHSNGKTKLINLIFCSSEALERRGKDKAIISKIREYVSQESINKNIPMGVINIFVESSVFKDSANEKKIKETPKPIISIGGNNQKDQFYVRLKKALRI